MKIKSSVKFKTQGLAATIGLAVTLGLAGCGGDSATDTNIENIDPLQPVSDWEMVWNDEFDGTAINGQNWTHEINCDGGGNGEKQCYTSPCQEPFPNGPTPSKTGSSAGDKALTTLSISTPERGYTTRRPPPTRPNSLPLKPAKQRPVPPKAPQPKASLP